MTEFNGSNGSTHSLVVGQSIGWPSVYPLDAEIKLQSPGIVSQNTTKPEERRQNVTCVKCISTLSSNFILADDAAISSLQQVFLGR